MVPRICFYISDFGYGHAARQIAIIRCLLHRAPEVEVFVKAGLPYAFLRRSLSSSRVFVIRQRNDVGIVARGWGVDRDGTAKALRSWVRLWGDWIENERGFCRHHGISMLVSDSPPQPLLLAREMGLVSALITNFLWDRIYRRLIGPLTELELIASAYASATLTWVLPFEVDPPAGQAVGLVARRIRRTRHEIRRQLGINEREVLAFLSTGRSMILSTDYFERAVSSIARDRLRILSSTWHAVSGVLAVPRDDVEVQDYVAACDVVVGKAGYGTLAEAVQARVPLLLFDNVVEGAPLVDIVEQLGIGRRIPATAFRDGGWVEHLGLLGRHRRAFSRLPERLTRDGAAEIASQMVRAVRG